MPRSFGVPMNSIVHVRRRKKRKNTIWTCEECGAKVTRLWYELTSFCACGNGHFFTKEGNIRKQRGK